MGKIANALNKYAKERKAAHLPNLTRADLKVLMSYNRETNHLLNYDSLTGKMDGNSIEALRTGGTIKRLLANKLIFPGGKLTPKGLQECDRLQKIGLPPSSAESAGDAQAKETAAAAGFDESNEVQEVESRQVNRSAEELPPASISGPAAGESDAAPFDRLLTEEPSPPLNKDDLSVSIPEAKDLVSETPLVSAPPSENKGEMRLEKQTVRAAVSEVATTKLDKPEKQRKKAVLSGPGTPYNENRLDANLVSLLQPHSFEAEQFKQLRSNILFPVSGSAPQSILVTGALPGEGKSFVAANLAISIAMNINKHVLLIDCDLRSPNLHRMFGYIESLGLSDYLAERMQLDSLLVKSCVDKLTLLPGGRVPSNPSELLSSDRMSDFIKEVKNRYSDRLIILDSPPPALAAETSFLARQVDGAILVVKYRKTPRQEVIDMIEAVGSEKILGTVVNQLNMQTSRYYGYKKYGKYGK